MMKRLLWIVLAVAAVRMTGLVPFESRDVAELVPVQTLTVAVEDGQVVLNGGGCRGLGADWDAALADLLQSGDGAVFLGTAEQIVLSDNALTVLPDVIRCPRLRPAAALCVCQGDPPDPDTVTDYLSAHDAGVTIQQVQSAMLAERGIALPRLVETEGGLRLEGA